MKAGRRPVRFLLIYSAIILFIVLLMQPLQVLRFHEYIAFLFPEGIIGIEQRNVFLITQAIMLLVIIPVYVLTYVFSWRYRASNHNAAYDPDLIDNKTAEFIWWGVPLVLTTIICILTWYKTHELDPYKPIASEKKPITIQAVALQYKWLFIYPEENIASLNFLQFPIDTPLRFEVTADAPMNSLWIPKLGGQIYAMPNSKTILYLMSNGLGDFRGSSANISGEGFADMYFTARSSTEEDYKKWVEEVKKSDKTLDFTAYNELAKPSVLEPETFKASAGLFEQILIKYMHPAHVEAK